MGVDSAEAKCRAAIGTVESWISELCRLTLLERLLGVDNLLLIVFLLFFLLFPLGITLLSLLLSLLGGVLSRVVGLLALLVGFGLSLAVFLPCSVSAQDEPPSSIASASQCPPPGVGMREKSPYLGLLSSRSLGLNRAPWRHRLDNVRECVPDAHCDVRVTGRSHALFVLRVDAGFWGWEVDCPGMS